MRIKLINFLKSHPKLLNVFYFFARLFLNLLGLFVKQKKCQIIFASFGGRKYDDSPKALFEYILNDKRFHDYTFVWAFVDPSSFEVKCSKKVKIDTFSFFVELFKSKIWISNTGIDRDIGLRKRGVVRIETWHGTPIKKICGEENSNSTVNRAIYRKKDTSTIRCSQSEYDQLIFSRVFNSSKENILLSDLPRNDALVHQYKKSEIDLIKRKIGIDDNKKVILYMPTYREYLTDEDLNIVLKPAINFDKWRERIGNRYVVLFRAHYAVNKVLNVKNNGFVFDVSNYDCLNDLYVVSDIMISDYSSSFFDYSILEKPILCFAYDLEEYEMKRGLYLDIGKSLPCGIIKDEDELLDSIIHLDYSTSKKSVKQFKNIYAPYAGKACEKVIDALIERIS